MLAEHLAQELDLGLVVELVWADPDQVPVLMVAEGLAQAEEQDRLQLALGLAVR